MGTYRAHVLVCAGAGCISSGCRAVKAALADAVDRHGLGGKVRIVETGCMGPCDLGPVVVVYPEGVLYRQLQAGDAETIVSEHLVGGRIADSLTYRLPGSDQSIPKAKDMPFFKRQTRIALRNTGIINPESIEDYIARDGYAALARAISDMTPEDVLRAVKGSGLRGRGGAGFPAGLKWEFCARAPGSPKYVVCNADEGDPGAFMDRSILEGDPHSILEAMAIAGYAVGASQGYIYVRAEYPLAVQRLRRAIDQAEEHGFLGRSVLGKDFDVQVDIRVGAGAFVCGEETALLASIEGRRGTPRPRPPFPATSGLWGKPTTINNVETLANVAPIILRGAEWFASLGTDKSKGTKVFALGGDVNNTGLVEVPMGTPLGDIVFEIGGGIPGGKKFKAAQTGGPSGGCIPAEYLNVPIDYESLVELGTIMGSGGLIVVDEDTCMVDFARFFLDFVQEESCGKCPPCRIGTRRMLEILNRISSGHGREGDIDLLVELGQQISDSALCGLGQSAANPVLTAIRYFRGEFEAHVRDGICPGSVCAALFTSPCQNTCPAGVDVPLYIDLIRQRRYEEAYLLIKEDMPLAAVCGYVCNHPCEGRCRRQQIDDPVAIRALKRFVADRALQDGGDFPLPARRAWRDGKVAVVGSGPAGLTAAYYLARKGYQVTVFESEEVPGGMLATAIPGYRLPRPVLEAEIEGVRRMGVDIRTGIRVGVDVTLDQLRDQGFSAIFVGVGAGTSTHMDIAGEDLDGVVHAVPFLRDVNLGRETDLAGKAVVVVGGGNAAVDAARTARRLGAREVRIVYRRRREDMPALADEIREALAEGVHIDTLVAPVRVVEDDGRAVGLELQCMEPGTFDRSGRPRPEPREGSEFTVAADMVIAAVGQEAEAEFSVVGDQLKLSRWGTVVADDRTQATSLPGVFAGDDCVTGADMVVTAIASGKRAAAAIDRYLGGDGVITIRRDMDRIITHDLLETKTPRQAMPMVPVDERFDRSGCEELGFDEEQAVAEARRCLRCDARTECRGAMQDAAGS